MAIALSVMPREVLEETVAKAKKYDQLQLGGGALPDSPEEKLDWDETITQVVQMMEEKFRKNVFNIMTYIKDHIDLEVWSFRVKWSESSIGSNIIDLLQWVVDKKHKQKPPDGDEFLLLLISINVPATWIPGVTKEYREAFLALRKKKVYKKSKKA